MPDADGPTGPTRSGVSDERNGENMDGGVGFHRRDRGGYGSVISSHDAQGAYSISHPQGP